MTSMLRPNPGAFDGHWLTPAQMARLAGVSTGHLGWLARNGKLPEEATKWAPNHKHRLYDAGKVLAAQRKGWQP